MSLSFLLPFHPRSLLFNEPLFGVILFTKGFLPGRSSKGSLFLHANHMAKGFFLSAFSFFFCFDSTPRFRSPEPPVKLMTRSCVAIAFKHFF